VECDQLLLKGGLVHGVNALGRRIVGADPRQVARKRRRRVGGHRRRDEVGEGRARRGAGEINIINWSEIYYFFSIFF